MSIIENKKPLVNTLEQALQSLPKQTRLALIDTYDTTRRRIGPHFAAAATIAAAIVERAKLQLDTAANLLHDPTARSKLEALKDGTPLDIVRTAEALKNTLGPAIVAQSIDEDAIRAIAARPYLNLTERQMRTRLRRTVKRATAKINLVLGMDTPYCSDYEVDLRRQQKAQWRSYAKHTIVETDRGDIPLARLMDDGRRRMAELYTLAKGMQKAAEAEGMTWLHITLTAPPHMHPRPTIGKCTWDGTLPDIAHQWIHRRWRRTLARLRKKDIITCGLRVAEPHKDACPHWHLLIWARPEHVETITDEIRRTWTSTTSAKIDASDGRAQAASYLYKYISKHTEHTPSDTTTRVDAWRSTWGIRTWALWGLPPITAWREMRKLKTPPSDPRAAAAWRAARRGDAAAWIGLMGGLSIPAKNRPIKTEVEIETTRHTYTRTLIIHGPTGATSVTRPIWRLKYRKPLIFKDGYTYSELSKIKSKSSTKEKTAAPPLDGWRRSQPPAPPTGHHVGPSTKEKTAAPPLDGWRRSQPPAPPTTTDWPAGRKEHSYGFSDRWKRNRRGFAT